MIQIVQGLVQIVKDEVARAVSQRSLWAEVTSLSPLEVTPDGRDPRPILADSLVSGLRVGDRVRVEISHGRATIIGINGGGDVAPSLCDLRSGFTHAATPLVAEVRSGIVFIHGGFNGDLTAAQTAIADLPIHIPRPGRIIPGSATWSTQNSGVGLVNQNGIVYVRSQAGAATGAEIWFTVSYPAPNS